jgi:hypothetical protein
MPKFIVKHHRHHDEPLLSSFDTPTRKMKLPDARQFRTKTLKIKPRTTQGYTTTESRDDCDDVHLLSAISDEMYHITTEVEEREAIFPLMEVVDFGGFEADKEVDTVSISDTSVVTKEEEGSLDSREYCRMYATITRGGESSSSSSADSESELTIRTECNDAKSISVMEMEEQSVGSVKSVKEMNDAYQLNILDESSLSGKSGGCIQQIKDVYQINLLDEASFSDGTNHSRANEINVIYNLKEDTSSDGKSTTSSNLLGLHLQEEDISSIMSEHPPTDTSVVSSTAPSSILHGVDFIPGDEVEVFTPSRSNSSDDNALNGTDAILIENATSHPSYLTREPNQLPTIPTMTFSVDSPSDDRRFCVEERPVVVTPTEYGDVIVLGGLVDSVSCVKRDVEHRDNADNGVRVDLEPKFTRTEGRDELHEAEESSKQIPTLVSTTSEESASESTAALSFSGLQIRDFDDDVFNQSGGDEMSQVSDYFQARDDWKPEDDVDSVCSQPFGCCTINVDVKRTILYGSVKAVPLEEVEDVPMGELSPPSTPRQSFVANYDWDVQEDCSGGDSSEPFGSCTIKVKAEDKTLLRTRKETIPSVVELSPPNTPKVMAYNEESPRFVYPEINMLDLSSDEDEYDISSHGSSPFDSFRLRDRFKDLNEYMESDSGNDDSKCLNNVDDSPSSEDTEESYGEESAIAVIEECSSSTGSDANSINDGKSCVSNILNESTRTFGVVSDDGAADFDALKNFWALEWIGVTNEQTTDCHETMSYAESGCSNFGGSVEDLDRYEYSDIDNSSHISRTYLETVEEDVAEESEDEGSAADSVESVIEANDTAKGVHLVAEGDSDDSNSSMDVVSMTDMNANQESDDVCLAEVAKLSPATQMSVAFRASKSTKRQCMRVKKWAVVKAKLNKSKYSLDRFNGETVIRNIDTGAAPPAEVDKVVRTALDLISMQSKTEKEANNDMNNQSLVRSFSLTGSLENEEESSSTLDVPTGLIRDNNVDCLGQLRHFLSPKARECRLGDGLATKDVVVHREPCTEVIVDIEHEQEDQTSSISVTASEEEETRSEVVVEMENVSFSNSIGDSQELKKVSMPLFDDIHPPELGTLTQKLYYTNTELAETLAVAQSELEMANRKAKVLELERDQLLNAVIRVHQSEGKTGVESDVMELLRWLDERNDLVD